MRERAYRSLFLDLSPMEQKIYLHAAKRARSIREIAQWMGLAENTVSQHLRRIRLHCGAADHPKLVRQFYMQTIKRLRSELREIKNKSPRRGA